MDTEDKTKATKPTYSEAVDTLTGYEEIAIENQFGDEFFGLSIVKRMRALAFVFEKREGLSDKDAKKKIMSLSQAAIGEYFSDEDDEDDEGDEDLGIEPVTDAGKGDVEPD